MTKYGICLRVIEPDKGTHENFLPAAFLIDKKHYYVLFFIQFGNSPKFEVLIYTEYP